MTAAGVLWWRSFDDHWIKIVCEEDLASRLDGNDNYNVVESSVVDICVGQAIGVNGHQVKHVDREAEFRTRQDTDRWQGHRIA